MKNFDETLYQLIKGWSTKRIIRLRDMQRLIINPVADDLAKMRAINKELRERTKRRYGKEIGRAHV